MLPLKYILVLPFLACSFLPQHVAGCASSIFSKDAHVFDNLFFNTTVKENNETGTLAPMPTTIVQTRSVNPITSAPLPFAFPDLPKLFGFGKSKWTPFGKHTDFSLKLIANPTWRLKESPPVSWTYCFPLCGSGDQALGIEDATDNAYADVFAALSEAMTTLNLPMVSEDQVKIRYTPKNTVLEEFGDCYDKTAIRYRVVRGSVRYRYSCEFPSNFTENIEEIDISIKSSPAYTESVWKNVATKVVNYLTNELYTHVQSKPILITYLASEKPFFFF